MIERTLPRAFERLPVAGAIRSCPEDFVVEERALDNGVRATSAADCGSRSDPVIQSEHLLLWIEKRGVNSQRVAEDLVRLYAVADVDVSFAGMKDRHAVTRQWFSVRTPRAADAAGDGWRVLESHRAPRKLRRGDLAGNTFVIRIRNLTGDPRLLTERLERLRDVGVPNYFGPQRFGRDGANVERARAWILHRPRPRVSPFQKGLHLSTARALLFNAVLAVRVQRGIWHTLVDGDVADGEFPTGPLWGRGRNATSGSAAGHEMEALAAYAEWLSPLEHLGLMQERRTLVARPRDLRWQVQGAELELRFELPPGQYATVLLRELGAWCDAAAVGTGCEALESTP